MTEGAIDALSAAAAGYHAIAVDGDGQVYFVILPGSVAKNRHFRDRNVAWYHPVGLPKHE